MTVNKVLIIALIALLLYLLRISFDWFFSNVERRVGPGIALIFFAGLIALMMYYYR